MRHPATFPTRTLSALALGALLSACNYNAANDGVRDGPQAVHPGTFAPGRTVTVTADPGTACGGADQPACYTPVAGDGSQPILD